MTDEPKIHGAIRVAREHRESAFEALIWAGITVAIYDLDDRIGVGMEEGVLYLAAEDGDHVQCIYRDGERLCMVEGNRDTMGEYVDRRPPTTVRIADAGETFDADHVADFRSPRDG